MLNVSGTRIAMTRRIHRLLLLMCLAFFSLGVHAAEWTSQAERDLSAWREDIARWEEQLPERAVLAERLRQAAELRERASQCAQEIDVPLASIRKKLEALGEGDKGDAPDLKQHRRALEQEKRKAEEQLALCRLLSLAAEETAKEIKQLRNRLLSRELLAHEVDLVGLLERLAAGEMATAGRQLQVDWIRTAVVGGVALFLLFPLSLSLAHHLRSQAPRGGERTGLARPYALRLPWLGLLLPLAIGFLATDTLVLAYPLLGIALAITLAPWLQRIVCEDAIKTCRTGLAARLLLALVLIGVAFVVADASVYAPTVPYLLGRGLFLALLLVLSGALLIGLSRRDGMGLLANLRLPLLLALLPGPLAFYLGYHALSAYLTLGVYGSLGALLLVWLFNVGVSGGAETLQTSTAPWMGRTRKWLGYGPKERIKGLRLFTRMLQLVALIALGVWLLYIWSPSPPDTAAYRDVYQHGFEIGSVRFVPSQIVSALLILVGLIYLAGWLRRQMEDAWLVHTRLDKGARQSIVALTSYAIVGLAILLALSIVGVEMQNLAIIAGALSVGIGFGLQNIVNNFVSGLILLFERPVRPGDWVVVGSTEGYVKKVSIRSTLIQTFDRADVLVPNSELIASQVTNWMLSDNFGRVIVPVGVAYGSDTGLVRDTLLKVAAAHPLVVVDHSRVSNPKVLFMGFGDSSLNFELRCFIREVDSRLITRSDLLFAIDAAFREEGIEIPFPQRVVHMPHTERKDTGGSDTAT
jgi:small-conductance mechanosensitive channel